jgi:predicted deacylase
MKKISLPETDERLEISGLKLARGERHKTRLRILELVDGSMLEVPVMVLRGWKPGPVFYLGAAFHGDEVNGVEIVAKFARSIDLRDLRGTIILVPAQNPQALQCQHRYAVSHLLRSPLDQSPADPWVCFPGECDGHIPSQLAHVLFTELMQHANYFVDVHTPTTGGRYAPFAFLPPRAAGAAVSQATQLAQHFGADFILATDHGVYVQDQSPHVVLAKRGTVALGLEVGEGGLLDPEVTKRGLRGLRNMINAIGMLEGDTEDFGTKIVIGSMKAVRATRGGLLHRRVELNDIVKKGEVVATITDLFGEVVEEIVAPQDGPIVRVATFPAVSAGERVVQLGE